MKSDRSLTLGVLDQSPIRSGETAADGLKETVKLAQATEQLGYARYWVAEHHNTHTFAGTSPEVLIGQIAARTNAITVGSGGVMLPHYSALKVAEQFRVLDSFYPGRLELGIGRAPGSDQLTAAALSYPRPQMDVNLFPRQVMDLLSFLTGQIAKNHVFAGIRAQAGPDPETTPTVWLLGSSDYSARLAALICLPFAFADFFGTTGRHGPAVAELYRKEFHPSDYLKEPRINVTVQALCAPTEEEALFLAGSRNISKAGSILEEHRARMPAEEAAEYPAPRPGLLPPEEAAEFPLNDKSREYIESLKTGYLDGDPAQVKRKIIDAVELYGAQDVSVVTTCYSYEHRHRSYELIAEAFGLEPYA